MKCLRSMLKFNLCLALCLIPSICLAQYQTKASQIRVDSSNFDNNLSSDDNDMQKIAEKVDQLVASGGSTPSGSNGDIQVKSGSSLSGVPSLNMSYVNWQDARNLSQGVNWYQADLTTKNLKVKGGIQGETISNDYELLLSSPSTLGTTTNEVGSFGKYENDLYIGYDDEGTGNKSSQIYKWDGKNYTFFYKLGQGVNFENVPSMRSFHHKLYVSNAGSKAGNASIWICDPHKVTSYQLDFYRPGFTDTSNVSIPSDSSNNSIYGSTAYSVEIKARIDDFGYNSSNVGYLLSKNNSSGSTGFSIFQTSGNGISVNMRDGSSHTTTTSTTYNLGNNVDIIMSWTSGNYPKIYINGVEASYSATSAVTTPSDDTANPILLGNNYSNNRAFAGSFKRVKIWRGHAIDDAEAATLAAGGSIGTSTTGEYLFQDGSGTTVADTSGNGNNGTISGYIEWNNDLCDVDFAPGDAQFIYSLGIHHGYLYSGTGYSSSTGAIYRTNGDGNWTSVWTASGIGPSYGLVNGIYSYKGRLFAALAGTGGAIISSGDDGATWITEATTAVGSGFTRFKEFNGSLFVGNFASSNQVWKRDDLAGTWGPAASFSGPTQCWGLENYDLALMVGCTNTLGAQIYKSYDGTNFTLDKTLDSGSQYGGTVPTEVFNMINYNSSLLVGVGFHTNNGDVWRKTNSLGHMLDEVKKFLDKFRYSSNGVNWTDDNTVMSISAPVAFDSKISPAPNGINWDLISNIGAQSNINWADAIGQSGIGRVLTRTATGVNWSDMAGGSIGGSSPWNTSGSDINYTDGKVSIGTTDTDGILNISQDSPADIAVPTVSLKTSGENQLDNSSFTGTDEAWDNTWEAIQFSTGSGTTNGTICTQLKTSATLTNPAQQFTMKVYTESAGHPGSAVSGAGSTFVRWGALTTSYQDFCVYISTTLSTSTNYWLVLQKNATEIGGTVYINSTTSGTNSHAYSSAGSSWTTESNKDGYVKIYGKNASYSLYSSETNPGSGGKISATSYFATPINGLSYFQNGVIGTNYFNGQGGLFTGHYSTGVLAQSNYGVGVSITSILGENLLATQSGTLTYTSNAPMGYFYRNPTLSSYDITGPVLRVESNIADSGDLLQVYKQNVPRVRIKASGAALLNNPGGVIIADSSSLGSEKVTNGTFTGNATGWTLGSGWTYSSNLVVHSTGSTADLSQNVNAVPGETYLVTLTVGTASGTVSRTGTFTISLGGTTLGKWNDNTGASSYFPLTYNFIGTAVSSASLIISPDTNFNGSIDTISVKKITDGKLTAVGSLNASSLNTTSTNGINWTLISNIGAQSNINWADAIGNWDTGSAAAAIGRVWTRTSSGANWSDLPSGGGGSMVYPGAGIANSTGSAWTTSYSTTGSGNVVLATSPTLTTPTLGKASLTSAYYGSVIDNGNSGTSKTIDWTAGNKQKITTTGSCTLTFTAPSGPTSLTLKIIHEASTTSYTYTWPASVKWVGGSALTTTNTSGSVDVVTLFYDGTNYYAQGAANFS